MNPHAAPLEIVTWLLLATSGLAIICRMWVKLLTSKRVNLDDVFAVLALLFNVGAGVAVSIAAENGLGAPGEELGEQGFEIMEKSMYAAAVNYVLSVACAKLSVVILLRLLFIKKAHQTAIRAVAGVIITQMLGCTVAALVPCRASRVWDIHSGHCFDLEGFWRSVGIINIFIDVILIGLPCYLVADIQMSLADKAIVVSCFAIRLIDIGATATQITFTHGFKSSDLSVDLWQWYLIGQVTQTAGIISSSAPYLRKPLLALPSGRFRSEHIECSGPTFSDAQRSSMDMRYTLRDVDSGSERKAVTPSQGSDSPTEIHGWHECEITTLIQSDKVPSVIEVPGTTGTEREGRTIRTSKSITVSRCDKAGAGGNHVHEHSTSP